MKIQAGEVSCRAVLLPELQGSGTAAPGAAAPGSPALQAVCSLLREAELGQTQDRLCHGFLLVRLSVEI